MKKAVLRGLTAVFALFWLLVAILPFLYMILTSLKQQTELFTSGMFALPRSFYLGNFTQVLTQGAFPRYLMNSLFVVGVSLLLTLSVSAFAAYPLSRFAFRDPGPSIC